MVTKSEEINQIEISIENREAVIKEYAPMIKYVAIRIAKRLPPHIEVDDLISVGVLGLIDAVEKYDADRGAKFKTYAEFRVRGAILDELRSMDWVPRSTRAKSREIERVISKLENELGRSPSEQELAAGLNVQMDEYYSMIEDVSSTSLLSLDEMTYGEDDDKPVPLVDTLRSRDETSALMHLESVEVRELLADSLGELTEQERLVIALYYYEELTLKEIGQVLELSESRVSQLHTKAVLSLHVKLRRRLTA